MLFVPSMRLLVKRVDTAEGPNLYGALMWKEETLSNSRNVSDPTSQRKPGVRRSLLMGGLHVVSPHGRRQKGKTARGHIPCSGPSGKLPCFMRAELHDQNTSHLPTLDS